MLYIRYKRQYQSINQSIKVICNACNVVRKLESEAQAVASGRVLMVIEKVGLEASFKFSVPDSRIVSGISFHTVGAACRKARRLKLVLMGGMCNSCWLAKRMIRNGMYGWRR